MKYRLAGAILSVTCLLVWVGGVAAVEKLDRGLVALEQDDGSVFLSWRFFQSDPGDAAFAIYRRSGDTDDKVKIVTAGDRTNFIDRDLPRGSEGPEITYEVRLVGGPDDAAFGTATVRLTGRAKSYLSVPLDGDYDFQKVGVGDLDGDGSLEFLIKQPNFNTDPYQRPGYWKKSTTTYKIEAYRLDGEMLWRHDMGWSIEAGIWYSPWVVCDVDGDGKAEVYCKAGEGDPRDEKGLVQSGPEWLAKIDGETGTIVKKTPWIGREEYSEYNYYCRNFLTVAYLDGVRPSIVMQRGTYRLITTAALDKDFKELWRWRSTDEKQTYGGQGSHGLITADVDGDGRDELVIGAAVLDEHGKGLWTLEMGHPDVCYVADIDPDNPGLEIFYGIERRQKTDGLCLVDAKTGRKLWALKEPTYHVHGQGMVGDVLAETPGTECYAGERDYEKRWLYAAGGKQLEFNKTGSLSPRPVWWDADEQKEVVDDGAIRDWKGPAQQRVEGRVIAVMDCLGDYREEVITALKGEMRVYTTTTPVSNRRVCLMQDHQYRLGLVAQTMGYYYPAQLGLPRR